MKKVIVALAVFLLASPAWALDVWCTVGEGSDANLFTISFSGASAGACVRGMAFDIQLDGDGTFSDVQCLSAAYGYQIYPGSISIDGSGNVSDWGSCRCSGDYPGTFDDANAMTIEMASAYEAGVDEDPCDSGDLVSFRVSGSGSIGVDIVTNAIRGEVVDENADPVTPGIAECDISPCMPTCREPGQCGGHDDGDVNCDGCVNFIDLGLLKAAFFSTCGQPNYNCCADFNDDCGCNFIDLGIMKANFFDCGFTPATGNQNCPAVGARDC
jgi:hypothetical protein